MELVEVIAIELRVVASECRTGMLYVHTFSGSKVNRRVGLRRFEAAPTSTASGS